MEVISLHPVFAEWGPKGKGVYYIDVRFVNKRGATFPEFGGFYYHPLGRAEAIRLMESSEVIASFDLKSDDFGGAGLWRGVLTLSPAGDFLAIMIRHSLEDGTDLYVYNVDAGTYVDLGKPSQHVRIPDLVISLKWSPNEQAFAGMGGDVLLPAIKVFDLESEAWTILVPLPGNPTLLSIYGLTKSKTISWAQ